MGYPERAPDDPKGDVCDDYTEFCASVSPRILRVFERPISCYGFDTAPPRRDYDPSEMSRALSAL